MEETPAEKVRASLVHTIFRVTERKGGRVYRAIGPNGEKLYVADRTGVLSWLLGENHLLVIVSYGLRQRDSRDTYDEFQYVIPRREAARKYDGIGRITSKRPYEEAPLRELADLERFILTWRERSI